MNVKETVLAEGGYDTEDKLLKDIYLLNTLAKIEHYSAECEFFEKKYLITLKEFKKFLHKGKGKEDFEKENDLEDWEFAANALIWWGKKMKELKIAKTN